MTSEREALDRIAALIDQVQAILDEARSLVDDEWRVM